MKHESNFNTTALNPVSGDHGLFQISELYWCSPGGHACGVSCASLEDDDIEDDVICARRIYRQHQRISGDGYNAWAVYPYYCKGDVSSYVKGCFERKEYDGFAETPIAKEGQEAAGDKSWIATVTKEGPSKAYGKSDKVLVYKSAKANYAFNWKANGFRLIKMADN